MFVSIKPNFDLKFIYDEIRPKKQNLVKSDSKKENSSSCLLYYMKREELLPSNASVILQICENDAPLAQANTTSII